MEQIDSERFCKGTSSIFKPKKCIYEERPCKSTSTEFANNTI